MSVSIEEKIEEIEEDQSANLEQVYRLVEQAEQIQPLLLPEARRYNEYVDGFTHADSDESEIDDVPATSESMLAHESAYLVELVERHEALLEDVRDSIDELQYCNGNKYIDGTEVRKEDLRGQMEDLIEDYEEDLNEALKICSRLVPEEHIPDPLHIKSVRNQRKAQREVNSEDIMENGASVEGFFAD